MNKKITNLFVFFLFGIFLISLISAQEVSYCCEKTIVNPDGSGGMWCQNDDEAACDNNYFSSQTSCEATSYCKEGCCYNSKEGTCLKNTPERVCSNKGGIWNENQECEIPQCDLGCCLIGNQAAFVTQTRCKRLSNLYGIPIIFRSDISSELQCIASTRSKVLGACVFEKEFERTCEMLTQEKCFERESEGTEIEFYEGKLCSNDELNTNCGPSQQTTCADGKDGVYFLDSCGNLANIYDSTKYEDSNYWAEIKSYSETCVLKKGNKKTCGNCDYFLGSTCKKAELGDVTPAIGDYICEDLGCQDGLLAEEFEDINGRTPEHGETWCSQSGGVSYVEYFGDEEVEDTDSLKENLPGSRYFRLLCYNGEITIEPCADYRQQICIESQINVEDSSIDFFKTAICRVNRWEDCVVQEDEKACNNTNKRDCKWVLKPQEVCIPRYSPGFDFWESTQDAEDMCNIASRTCIVEYQKKIGKDWSCKDNCDCERDKWAEESNEFCASLGDCGSNINYIGEEGYYKMDDLISISSRLSKGKLKQEAESEG